MSWSSFKDYSKWLSQISAATSFIIIVFVKSKFVFDSGNTAGKLVLISTITALFTLVFGVISLPRWQGFIALAVFSYVMYGIFLASSLYAVH